MRDATPLAYINKPGVIRYMIGKEAYRAPIRLGEQGAVRQT
jgi:hypothetical protein